MVAAQLITWTQPCQMLSSGSLGTMGVSLGYCIGAKLAHGGAKICISIDGDGSFNMTFTELKIVGELKIPIKHLILDNDGQMMVEYWQCLFHGNCLIVVCNQRNPDYIMLTHRLVSRPFIVIVRKTCHKKCRNSYLPILMNLSCFTCVFNEHPVFPWWHQDNHSMT